VTAGRLRPSIHVLESTADRGSRGAVGRGPRELPHSQHGGPDPNRPPNGILQSPLDTFSALMGGAGRAELANESVPHEFRARNEVEEHHRIYGRDYRQRSSVDCFVRRVDEHKSNHIIPRRCTTGPRCGTNWPPDPPASGEAAPDQPQNSLRAEPPLRNPWANDSRLRDPKRRSR
jgi:hypothetical protein